MGLIYFLISAVCEKCGAIGVKHAFYGKERKYCSLACARPVTSLICQASSHGGNMNNELIKVEENVEIKEEKPIQKVISHIKVF